MIQLTISKEAVTDLLTPQKISPDVLTEGLPPGCDLLNVTYDAPSGMVTYIFDDGQPGEVAIGSIEYIRTQ